MSHSCLPEHVTLQKKKTHENTEMESIRHNTRSYFCAKLFTSIRTKPYSLQIEVIKARRKI
jgi:hypothetical protein